MKIFNYLIIIFTVFFCIGCSGYVKYQYETQIEFNSTLSLENVSDSIINELNMKKFMLVSHDYYEPESLIQKEFRSTLIHIKSPYEPVIEISEEESKFYIRVYTWNYVYDYKNEKSLEVKELRDILKKWSEKHPKTILNYSAKGKINGRTRGILN